MGRPLDQTGAAVDRHAGGMGRQGVRWCRGARCIHIVGIRLSYHRRGHRGGSNHRGNRFKVMLKHHIHPVVAVQIGSTGETACRTRAVYSVKTVHTAFQSMEGWVVYPGRGEVRTAYGIASVRRIIGDNIGSVRRNRDGRCKIGLLPPGGRLIGKGHTPESRPIPRPQTSRVRPRVEGIFVKP